MQDRIVVENVTDGAGVVRARGPGRPATSPTSSRSRSTTSRSATRCDAKAAARRRSSRVFDGEHAQFVLDDRARRTRRRRSRSRKPGDVDGGTSATGVELAPARALGADHGRRPQPRTSGRRSRGRSAAAGSAGARARARLAHRLAAARPAAGGDLGRARSTAFARSVVRPRVAADARRQRTASARLPAAGMPWFMTVFGRDTLITSYQTLLFGPELARGALEVLAELQATEDDPSIDAEPGKIVHEVRHGKAAKVVVPRATTARSTRPRSTSCCSRRCGAGRGDAALVDAAARAGAARRSSGSTRTATSTATASSSTERRTERGLENQSWKDSGDSQRFADGRHCRRRRSRPCEVQGYVYDAKRGRPSSPARSGASRSSPSGSRPRPPSCGSASTRPSGSTSAAGTTRSRSTREKRARRLALLEHRPPALERDRPAGARRRRSSPR